jgi:glutamate-1-semialdehyde 2,1-aminomutase
MTNSADRALRARAEAVIPGGMYGHQSTALLPLDYPQFFTRGKGPKIWDADGKEYLDLMCAYGTNLFGYAHEGVDEAYIKQLREADTLTGPTPLIVDLAEQLVAMVSHASWAMFCKNGTDATTMAVMTARQHTGKKTIILAKGAYHGADPWCTPRPGGVTPEDRANQIFCAYNNVESLNAAVEMAGHDLAAIMVAPFKHDAFIDQEMPEKAFALRARELANRHNALLIVDEVRGGFRVSRDCSWKKLGVQPDLSAWGKALANGHAISALLGSEIARKAAADIFVTGSFWFQGAPMAAALATLKLIRETDYLERIEALGSRLRTGLDERAKAHGFKFGQTGPVTMPLFLFEDDTDLMFGFEWASLMLARGVYTHPWHNMFLNAAMTEADIDAALIAAEDAFKTLKARAPSLKPAQHMSFLKRRRAERTGA